MTVVGNSFIQGKDSNTFSSQECWKNFHHSKGQLLRATALIPFDDSFVRISPSEEFLPPTSAVSPILISLNFFINFSMLCTHDASHKN